MKGGSTVATAVRGRSGCVWKNAAEMKKLLYLMKAPCYTEMDQNEKLPPEEHAMTRTESGFRKIEMDREDMLALTRRMTVSVHRSQESQGHISIRTDLWTGHSTPVS